MTGFTIRNEIGATVFAILSGLSILFFTAWAFSPGGCARPENPTIPPVPVAGAKESNPPTQDSNGGSESESSRRASLALSLRESEEARVALAEENEALLVSHSEATAQLEQWNALLSAEGGVETDITAVMARMAALEEEADSLRAQLAETPQADFAALEASQKELKKQLASERKACREAKAKLNEEIDSLRKELDETLYGEQLKPAGDFPALDLPYLVNDPIQLNRKVRPVFIQLREVNEESSEIEKLYAKLTEDGKTKAPHTVPFAVGSAEVTGEEEGKLNNLLQNVPEAARFLVVGYASTDGDAKSNYELSSERASSVATTLAANEGVAEEAVQAVYFGQTKRFSATEMAPNRIVEVWLVK